MLVSASVLSKSLIVVRQSISDYFSCWPGESQLSSSTIFKSKDKPIYRQTCAETNAISSSKHLNRFTQVKMFKTDIHPDRKQSMSPCLTFHKEETWNLQMLVLIFWFFSFSCPAITSDYIAAVSTFVHFTWRIDDTLKVADNTRRLKID
jgi:hypothetical protein